jgi:hypothetical protein
VPASVQRFQNGPGPLGLDVLNDRDEAHRLSRSRRLLAVTLRTQPGAIIIAGKPIVRFERLVTFPRLTSRLRLPAGLITSYRSYYP